MPRCIALHSATLQLQEPAVCLAQLLLEGANLGVHLLDFRPLLIFLDSVFVGRLAWSDRGPLVLLSPRSCCRLDSSRSRIAMRRSFRARSHSARKSSRDFSQASRSSLLIAPPFSKALRISSCDFSSAFRRSSVARPSFFSVLMDFVDRFLQNLAELFADRSQLFGRACRSGLSRALRIARPFHDPCRLWSLSSFLESFLSSSWESQSQ